MTQRRNLAHFKSPSIQALPGSREEDHFSEDPEVDSPASHDGSFGSIPEHEPFVAGRVSLSSSYSGSLDLQATHGTGAKPRFRPKFRTPLMTSPSVTALPGSRELSLDMFEEDGSPTSLTFHHHRMKTLISSASIRGLPGSRETSLEGGSDSDQLAMDFIQEFDELQTSFDHDPASPASTTAVNMGVRRILTTPVALGEALADGKDVSDIEHELGDGHGSTVEDVSSSKVLVDGLEDEQNAAHGNNMFVVKVRKGFDDVIASDDKDGNPSAGAGQDTERDMFVNNAGAKDQGLVSKALHHQVNIAGITSIGLPQAYPLHAHCRAVTNDMRPSSSHPVDMGLVAGPVMASFGGGGGNGGTKGRSHHNGTKGSDEGTTPLELRCKQQSGKRDGPVVQALRSTGEMIVDLTYRKESKRTALARPEYGDKVKDASSALVAEVLREIGQGERDDDDDQQMAPSLQPDVESRDHTGGTRSNEVLREAAYDGDATQMALSLKSDVESCDPIGVSQSTSLRARFAQVSKETDDMIVDTLTNEDIKQLDILPVTSGHSRGRYQRRCKSMGVDNLRNDVTRLRKNLFERQRSCDVSDEDIDDFMMPLLPSKHPVGKC